MYNEIVTSAYKIASGATPHQFNRKKNCGKYLLYFFHVNVILLGQFNVLELWRLPVRNTLKVPRN